VILADGILSKLGPGPDLFQNVQEVTSRNDGSAPYKSPALEVVFNHPHRVFIGGEKGKLTDG